MTCTDREPGEYASDDAEINCLRATESARALDCGGPVECLAVAHGFEPCAKHRLADEVRARGIAERRAREFETEATNARLREERQTARADRENDRADRAERERGAAIKRAEMAESERARWHAAAEWRGHILDCSACRDGDDPRDLCATGVDLHNAAVRTLRALESARESKP